MDEKPSLSWGSENFELKKEEHYNTQVEKLQDLFFKNEKFLKNRLKRNWPEAVEDHGSNVFVFLVGQLSEDFVMFRLFERWRHPKTPTRHVKTARKLCVAKHRKKYSQQLFFHYWWGESNRFRDSGSGFVLSIATLRPAFNSFCATLTQRCHVFNWSYNNRWIH